LLTGYKRDSEQYLTDQIEWGVLTSSDEERVKATFTDYFWGYASFILFICGCIAGAISLFCSPT
jgi:hypothetical protein